MPGGPSAVADDVFDLAAGLLDAACVVEEFAQLVGVHVPVVLDDCFGLDDAGDVVACEGVLQGGLDAVGALLELAHERLVLGVVGDDPCGAGEAGDRLRTDEAAASRDAVGDVAVLQFAQGTLRGHVGDAEGVGDGLGGGDLVVGAELAAGDLLLDGLDHLLVQGVRLLGLQPCAAATGPD